MGEESGKRKRWMIGRGVAVMILSIALFAVVFLVAGLAGLFLTGNLERAGLTGGVCGFATAWPDEHCIHSKETDRRRDPPGG